MKIINGIKIFQLEINETQLSVIHEGLMQVPFGRAAPVVNAINHQLEQQIKPPRQETVSPDPDVQIAQKPLPEGADYDRTTLHNGLASG